MAQAGRALVEVLLEPFPGLGGHLAVEQQRSLGDHRRALGVVGIDGADGDASSRRS
jgi:hypothetical protein